MSIHRFGSGKPLVSVCVPTLGAARERIEAMLAALEAHTYISYEVVIFDCEGVVRGYTEPQNKAMAAGHGKYLVAMNDDVLVSRGWLEGLLEVGERPGQWCTTPDMTHTDGPQVFHPYLMLWQREGWEALRGLDEQFVFWCSDIDAARRLEEVGHLPAKVLLPESVRHATGSTATTPEHQAWINETCLHDLQRYRQKWGVDPEAEKYRLRDLVSPPGSPWLMPR